MLFIILKNYKLLSSSSTGEDTNSNVKDTKAVRESVRLRLKQENKRHNQNLSRDPIELTNLINKSSISITPIPSQISQTYQSPTETPVTSTICNSSRALSIVNSGNPCVVSSQQQQEAAIAMTNLQQQGVLNLTQHHPTSIPILSNMASGELMEQPSLVTFVNPLDLHNTAHGDATLRMPMVATHQPIPTIPINAEQNVPQYIACQINGNQLHVPVSEVYGTRPVVTTLPSQW